MLNILVVDSKLRLKVLAIASLFLEQLIKLMEGACIAATPQVDICYIIIRLDSLERVELSERLLIDLCFQGE